MHDLNQCFLGFAEGIHLSFYIRESCIHLLILERRWWNLIGKVLLIMRWLEIVGEVGLRLIVGVLNPREIRVISPTRIVCLRIWIIVRP